MLFRLIIAITAHALMFILFPDMGTLGHTYMWLSLAAWLFIVVMTNRIFSLINILGAANMLLFGLICAALALSMPQSDRKSPADKLRAGKYPTVETAVRGLRKLTGKKPAELAEGAKELGKKTGDTIKAGADKARQEVQQLRKTDSTKK